MFNSIDSSILPQGNTIIWDDNNEHFALVIDWETGELIDYDSGNDKDCSYDMFYSDNTTLVSNGLPSHLIEQVI